MNEDTIKVSQSSDILFYTKSGFLRKKDLEKALSDAGLEKGDIVMVHSDLKSIGKLGQQKNKEEFLNNIFDAFINVIGDEGTLVVPTYSYSFCNDSNNLFDIKKTKSTVGVFTEFVRNINGVIRSEDPIFSHAGIGKNAETLLNNVSSVCFGKDSFFDRLYKSGGKIVNFGDVFELTFIHYIEKNFGVDYRFDKKFSGTIILEDGSKSEKEYLFYARYLPKDGRVVQYQHLKLANELENRELLKKVPLGDGVIRCAKAKHFFDVGLEMLKNDPYAFLEQNPNILEFKQLPFYIGIMNSPENKGLPVSLPFTLEYDKNISLIKSKDVGQEEYLNKAYRLGSVVSANLGEGSFGERRANDILQYLLPRCKKHLSELSFLDVGCSEGYLLSKLKSLGSNEVFGCEPGPMATIGSEKYGINIIHDFFKPEFFNKKFDIVFSSGVLEHVKDPANFLELKKQVLKEDGTIFIGVPNCEKKLILGDISVLGHEHWNYFTERSLKSLLIKCGFIEVETAIGRNQAMLYAWGIKFNNISIKNKDNLNNLNNSDEKLFYSFCAKIRDSLFQFNERINQLNKEGKSLGLYGGGFELIGVLNHKSDVRFFNSDVIQQGTYYPGHNHFIENPKNLITNPVDELWVMAIDYDEEITNYLENELNISSNIKIFSFKNFLEKINSKANSKINSFFNSVFNPTLIPTHFSETTPPKLLFVNIYSSDSMAKYLFSSYTLKAYLSKSFTSSDITIKIVNIAESTPNLEIYEQIVKENPNYIGYSCYIWNIEKIIEIIKGLKERLKSTLHILGGPEISLNRIKSFSNPAIGDYYVIGEGERRLQYLISYLMVDNKNIKPPKGVAYWENGNLFYSKDNLTPIILDDIPSIYLNQVIDDSLYYRKQAFLETQRGCWLKCKYCVYHKNLSSVHYYSLNKIFAELKHLIVDKQVWALRIIDAVFTSNLSRSKQIINYLITLKTIQRVQLPWIYWELNYHNLDEEFIRLTAALKYRENINNTSKIAPKNRPQFYSDMLRDYTVINCMGLQSFNKETLKAIGRPTFNLEKFDNFMNLVNKHNIALKIDLILGLPFETINTYFEGLEFFLPYFRNTDYVLNIHRLQILPGSELEEFIDEYGINYSKDAPHLVFSTSSITMLELNFASKLTAILFRIINSPLRKQFFETKERTNDTFLGIIERILKNMSHSNCFKDTQIIKNEFVDDVYWNDNIFKEISSEWIIDFLKNYKK